ncbi:40S ribosomal protein S10-2-like isoform X1 [Hibiscus syriacus]|uniref:40S ribosomal protein S10-2-like isoform X1 n=1 Tax=Hibiscus syriacus TaxID=106335 RepID=UPI0019219803|nr:40S ribosomal protein S10-2-like isoform X1 [Hibiscus syriacus]XP_039032007.1 40S ribosomal protein S10-2-like isoform X1 [Hibiscus syriacus]
MLRQNQGITLPSEIVPATLKKQTRPDGLPMDPSVSHPRGPLRFGDGERRLGDRDGCRGGPRGGGRDFGDKGGAPADYQPSFRGSIQGLALVVAALLVQLVVAIGLSVNVYLHF